MATTDRRGITVGDATAGAANSPSAFLGWKHACVCASTVNLTLSGLQTIDGVTVTSGQRVLVTNQSTASENGIYNASSGVWSRASDMDGAWDVAYGTRVFVVGGSTQAESNWYVSSADPLTIGTSSLAFTQIT